MSTPAPFRLRFTPDWLKRHSHLTAQTQALDHAYEKALTKVEDSALQAMGSALWQALALGDELAKAKQQAGQQVLPIVIESSDAAILSLPWETLYNPSWGFLGRHVGFSLTLRKNLRQTRAFLRQPRIHSTTTSAPCLNRCYFASVVTSKRLKR